MNENPYESTALLDQYLLFHYGTEVDQLGQDRTLAAGLNYPVRCVELAVKHYGDRPIARALDLGCAVGRATFELSRYAERVVGIDLSASFINTATTLQLEGEISYNRKDEGNLQITLKAKQPPGTHPERIEFMTGDACNLDRISSLGRFDLVLAANLIDRLPKPRIFLQSIHRFIKPGGLLVLTSPYTWLEEYTSPSEWLGGREERGLKITTFDGINWFLRAKFEHLVRTDLPFLMREHSRKFQWSLAEATVWKRKDIG